ncbi:conserved hypothetical protein [Bradyrhizobium sp. ORS 285]|uniref:hypothetical protein n=1 Tax=Bradyrhizobium sp. ORS 285 TaxID=115808 RepID=UPI000240AB4E|nr:hypothetical protein [Bradyrhizobium sp. ORS 285]CCD85280.1 conserved hypothetical protein [Bradyrhizobium sp. ORS 285]SMX57469.1 conserved hypothetical protein [Bradyrhizobium sp. ORS 285]
MAELKRERIGEGAALLKKLRRLKLRTAAAGKDDRALLLALMDDIETVRRKLLRECAQLEEEFKVAAVRVTALNTYAKVAQASRRPLREH